MTDLTNKPKAPPLPYGAEYAIEDGVKVPVRWPDDHDGDDATRYQSADPIAVMRRVLSILSSGDGVIEAGRAALLLAYITHAPGASPTQRALAAEMGLSVAAVNKRLAILQARLAEVGAEMGADERE